MTDKEFVAEINSKCKNLLAFLNDRGMVIRSRKGKMAVCLYYYPRLFPRYAYGVMRRANGRVVYISKRTKQKIVEELKNAIGYK